MDRLPNHRFVPAIEAALRLTGRFHRYTGVPHFLCGVDPVFAGLHDFRITTDGRSYRQTAHCAYLHNQLGPADRRRTTIVLPAAPVSPSVIVHEYGHVLHEALRWEPTAQPVTSYAQTNRFESFAEAFTSYLYPAYADRPDEATLALLEAL